MPRLDFSPTKPPLAALLYWQARYQSPEVSPLDRSPRLLGKIKNRVRLERRVAHRAVHQAFREVFTGTPCLAIFEVYARRMRAHIYEQYWDLLAIAERSSYQPTPSARSRCQAFHELWWTCHVYQNN